MIYNLIKKQKDKKNSNTFPIFGLQKHRKTQKMFSRNLSFWKEYSARILASQHEFEACREFISIKGASSEAQKNDKLTKASS